MDLDLPVDGRRRRNSIFQLMDGAGDFDLSCKRRRRISFFRLMSGAGGF
jgi:hypothetical protein